MSTSPFLAGLLPVLEAAGQLKNVRRAGWVRVGVPNPESVAAHSYRVALMALLFGPRLGLDTEKLLSLALIHDLAEARVGDLTPADRVSPAEKRSRESVAFGEIVAALAEGPALESLWREYLAEASPEARIIHQLDKLEMALQALEYEQARAQRQKARPARARSHPEPPAANWADPFWESARAALHDPLLIEFYDYLRAQRPK